MNVRELLGRLGSPAYRHRCVHCQQLVGQIVRVALWGDADEETRWIEVCQRCEPLVEHANKVRVQSRVRNKMGAERVNREYFQSADRPSSLSYIEACERMRREGF